MSHELTPEALRERLRRDLPGALLDLPAEPEPAAPEEEADKGGKGAKGKGPEKVKLPAPTNDTLVQPERVPEVAAYLRDRLGYSFLSDIAAVDYLEAGIFEVVYFFFHPLGGTHLLIKTRVPREQPDIPALTVSWPGANLLEREAYDLYGINFIGHPYQMRIYMWDELEGHPMRKDFPKQGDKYLDEG